MYFNNTCSHGKTTKRDVQHKIIDHFHQWQHFTTLEETIQ